MRSLLVLWLSLTGCTTRHYAIWLSRAPLTRQVTTFRLDDPHCLLEDPDDIPSGEEAEEAEDHVARNFHWPDTPAGRWNAAYECCTFKRAVHVGWQRIDDAPVLYAPLCAWGLKPETPFYYKDFLRTDRMEWRATQRRTGER